MMPACLRRAAALALLLAPACALAADGKVPVQGDVALMRLPIDILYRKMVDGMDTFDSNHALAPKASLRFRLLPRQPGVTMNGIALKLIGDTTAIPIPVAADNSFALERNPVALAEDAFLSANRRADSMNWRPMIRSPGLDEFTRRLGDLRLECMVSLAADLIPKYASSTKMKRLLIRMGKYGCSSPDHPFLLFADRPLFKVTLRDGDRTEILSFSTLYAGGEARSAEWLARSDVQSLQDKTYFAPLHDKHWSDDTLVEFDYMDDEAMPAEALALGAGRAGSGKGGRAVEIGKSSKADVQAIMGEATQLAFQSGYEVWLYKTKTRLSLPDPTERDAPVEFVETVVLFDPSGKVKNFRGFYAN